MTIAAVVEEALHETVGLSTDECLKCNICNEVCPVARVDDRFPGPKYVGPQAQRFRLAAPVPINLDGLQVHTPDRTVDWCSGCGWCTTACPAGVKIAEVNSRARASMRAGRRPRFRDWLISQTDLLGRFGAPFTPLANWTLRNRLFRALIEVVLGIHRKAPLPVFAGRSFRSRFARRGGYLGRADGAAAAAARPGRRLLPRLRRQLLRAARRRRRDRRPRTERVRGDRAAAGMLRPADDQQRPVPGARGTRRGATSTCSPNTRGRATGSSGRRPRARTRSRPSTRRCSTCATRTPTRCRRPPGTSASSCSTCTSRAASTPASAASTRSCRTMPRASSGATGSGCRRWTCSRSCPGCGPSTWITTAAGSRARTGSRRRSTTSRCASATSCSGGSRRAARPSRVRLRDVPLADRVGDEPAVAAPGRDPRRGLRGRRRSARRATARTLGRMRVLVVGAGAVGSFLGWAVAAGGGETTLVRRGFDGTPGAPASLRLVRPDGTEAPVEVGVVRSVADAAELRTSWSSRSASTTFPPPWNRSRPCRTSRCSPPRTGWGRRRRPRPHARPGRCWRHR